jgi:hypothetical protein
MTAALTRNSASMRQYCSSLPLKVMVVPSMRSA